MTLSLSTLHSFSTVPNCRNGRAAYSDLCAPSQSGAFFVALQPQRYAVPDFSAV